jgi:3-oxoacyl-[acyl-carrier protein] reductase
LKLKDRVAVITGGSSGIGAGISRRFLLEGAKLAIIDKRENELNQFAGELSKLGGEVRTFVADVSNSQELDNVFASINKTFGQIDILVNNAGIWNEARFLEISEENWNKIISVNLTGMFLCSQRSARIMKEHKQGVIINIASTNGFIAEPKLAHYNASKGGVVMLTKSMAIDLAPYGIRVSGIAPGTIYTPLISDILDDSGDHFSGPPLGRWGEASEVAALAAFLASDDASYITGSIHLVDGGQIAINGMMPEDL